MIKSANHSSNDQDHVEHAHRLIDLGTMTWPQRLLLALAYFTLLAAAVAVTAHEERVVGAAAAV